MIKEIDNGWCECTIHGEQFDIDSGITCTSCIELEMKEIEDNGNAIL